jgi:outer membrane lipoprotein-sorting protein
MRQAMFPSFSKGVAAAALLLAVPAAAQAPTIAGIGAALAATRTMTADFTQTSGGRTVSGTMLLKRPGRVRFDYGRTSPLLVVADGRTLSFIDYGVAQVSQWPIRSTPLGVLLDPAADLGRLATVQPDSPLAGHVAVLAQDPRRPDQGRILFFLAPDPAAPGGLRLAGWRVTDAQDNRTDVRLTNVRWNMAIDDRRFAFRDPRVRARMPGRPG